MNIENGQQEIAQGISNALRTYISWIEKQQTPINNQTNNSFGTKQKTYAFLKSVDEHEHKTRGKAK